MCNVMIRFSCGTEKLFYFSLKTPTFFHYLLLFIEFHINLKCCDYMETDSSLPVLGKDEQLFRVVELLQYIREELAPPALASTKLHQQQAGMKSDLGRPTDAKMFEELLTGLGMECALEH